VERILILGAGAMGTGLAILLARAGRPVTLWVRDPAQAEALARDRENRRHLPGVPIPTEVVITAETHRFATATLGVLAIPSAYLRAALNGLSGKLPPGLPLVSVIKGIERGTFAMPTEIVEQTLGAHPTAILSGPSHAEEFARGLPTSVVVATRDPTLPARVRDTFHSETFRVYHNDDARGVELAGALKNILGLAAGICDGLAFGDNAKAALLTRGLVEMARYAERLGASPATFWGLAGVGDVLTTCYSGHGRNRAVGLRIGRGESLDAIQRGMADVAEGVFTTRSVHEHALAQDVVMPITAEVHAILFEGKPPHRAVTDLMLRDPGPE
jgi:glycerol-3-phosphate dehydrogenase (NAD(P)+)